MFETDKLEKFNKGFKKLLDEISSKKEVDKNTNVVITEKESPEIEQGEIAKLEQAQEDSNKVIGELSLRLHKAKTSIADLKEELGDSFSKTGTHEVTVHFKKLAFWNRISSWIYFSFFISMIIYYIACLSHYFIEKKLIGNLNILLYQFHILY